MTPREFRPLAAWIAWAIPIWRRVHARARLEWAMRGRPREVRRAIRACIRKFRRNDTLTTSCLPVTFPDGNVGLVLVHRSRDRIEIRIEDLGPATTVYEERVVLTTPILQLGPDPEIAAVNGER